MSGYPNLRLRRGRQAKWSRAIMRETKLIPQDFILPLFVIEGEGRVENIPTMPGVGRYSIDKIVETARQAYAQGVPAVMLFPFTPENKKNENGLEAFNPDNLICRAIKVLKKQVPDIGVISDIALDPYTSHGHDGILSNTGDVDNDLTVEVLCKQALTLAEAGVDAVAPSDMMDGRIKAIRDALETHSYKDIRVISYAAKYASNFYGPFREAIGSKMQLTYTNKKTYQMDPANVQEAIREIKLDQEEGADSLIIKPALSYLDVIKAAQEYSILPIFAYQVSGEYAMLKLGAENGLFDFRHIILESLTSIKRAGASSIITYAALEIAEYLNQHSSDYEL